MTRILIVTAGGTPQVVTETFTRSPHAAVPWWPEELVLVTTGIGGALYERGSPERRVAPLLGRAGKLAELAAALGRTPPQVRADDPLGPGKDRNRLRGAPCIRL